MVISQRKAIQKKLMAATSMLLVACIMLISASYAWFTLSTAPEITGITTNVGANGNLEIALATNETWADTTKVQTTTSKDSDITQTNTTWGNLVSLSNEAYGFDKIKLYPARLNYNGTIVSNQPLSVPKYGTDGRIDDLVPASYATYVDNGFTVGDGAGVRAIGTANAMTERQKAYRNYKADFVDKNSSATAVASGALSSNGSLLASIAMKYGLSGEDAAFTAEEYNAVLNVVNTLIDESTGVYAKAKQAWEAAILTYVASNVVEGDPAGTTGGATGITGLTTEEEFKAYVTAFNEGYEVNSTDAVTTITCNSIALELPEALHNYYVKMKALETTLDNAKATAADKTEKEETATATWSEINELLIYIVKTDGVKVNGYTVAQIKADTNLLISTMGSGITVELASGSGLFYDIAELCGNYEVNISLNVEYSGLKIENMPATMLTKAPAIVANDVSNSLNSAASPNGAGDASAVLTDSYGYQIDFLLRTNASNSNLLLQQEAAQRIYDDSTNAETMGAGSTFTFKSSSSVFSTDDMLNLMKNIRVVFMDKDRKIVGVAVVDLSDEVLKQDKNEDGTLKTDADGNPVYVQKTDGTGAPMVDEEGNPIYETETKNNYVVNEETSEVTVQLTLVEYSFNSGVIAIGDDKEEQVLIESMPANTAVQLSALVYLDGDATDNGDVANAISSMTGALNLQFASSANLIPMQDTSLMGEATSTETDGE